MTIQIVPRMNWFFMIPCESLHLQYSGKKFDLIVYIRLVHHVIILSNLVESFFVFCRLCAPFASICTCKTFHQQSKSHLAIKSTLISCCPILGISHPYDFLRWRDHQSETSISNKEVGRRWGCWPQTLGNETKWLFIQWFVHFFSIFIICSV